MKGKIFSVLLAICLLFTMMPATASAAEMKDFTFVVTDNQASEWVPISGVKGSISIMRDGAIIQTHEINEITVTVEDYSYTAYTVQLDISTLESADVFLCNLSCDRYYSITETVETVLEEECSMFGTVADWEAIEYSTEGMWVALDPWGEDIRTWNEVYYVGESEEDGTPYVYIAYEGVWNEDALIEALSYVEKDEVLRINIVNWTEDIVTVPKLSAKLMQELGKYNMTEIFYQIENGSVSFYNLKGTTDFEVILEKGNNASINDLLKGAGITSGYFMITLNGDATFTDSYVQYDIPTDLETVLTFPEEDVVLDSNGFGNSTTEKTMYRYEAEKNICYLVEAIDYQYCVGDYANDTDYYAIALENSEIKECGAFIITDENLPLSITTEKWVPVDVNTSMSTEEVTATVSSKIAGASEGSTVEVVLQKAMNIGADAMKKASETATPIVIEVKKEADNSSYINWSFAKIDNPVEFNPSVHVDATVTAVDTKLAAVELPSILKLTTVSFEFEGDLPGDAKVTLDIKNSELGITNTAEGAPVYLYYYDPADNIFILKDESAVTNGYATFDMEHCSDYVVTSEKLPSSATTKNNNNETDNNNGNNINNGTDNNGGNNTNNGTDNNGGNNTNNGTNNNAGNNTNNGTTNNGGNNTNNETDANAGNNITNEMNKQDANSPITGEKSIVVLSVACILVCAVAIIIRKRNTIK